MVPPHQLAMSRFIPKYLADPTIYYRQLYRVTYKHTPFVHVCMLSAFGALAPFSEMVGQNTPVLLRNFPTCLLSR